MSFDIKAFEKSVLTPRTEALPVPGLVDWFDIEGEQKNQLEQLTMPGERDEFAEKIGVVWKVRGLSDDELNQAEKDAKGSRAKIAEVMADMLKLETGDVDSIKERLGLDEEVGYRTAIRAEHVYRGSVEPKLSIALVHKLGKAFPIEFRQIATKVLELSGLGAIDEKKLSPSGTTKPSS